MRFIVEYTKEDGHIVGKKLFDMQRPEALKGQIDDRVRKAARATAGEGATILSVKVNDGSTDLGERKRYG